MSHEHCFPSGLNHPPIRTHLQPLILGRPPGSPGPPVEALDPVPMERCCSHSPTPRVSTFLGPEAQIRPRTHCRCLERGWRPLGARDPSLLGWLRAERLRWRDSTHPAARWPPRSRWIPWKPWMPWIWKSWTPRLERPLRGWSWNFQRFAEDFDAEQHIVAGIHEPLLGHFGRPLRLAAVSPGWGTGQVGWSCNYEIAERKNTKPYKNHESSEIII